MSSRSARSKRGWLFWGLRRAATTTSSNSLDGALHNLEMSVVEGIEGAGKEADFHESELLR